MSWAFLGATAPIGNVVTGLDAVVGRLVAGLVSAEAQPDGK